MLASIWQIGGKVWGDLPSSFGYSIGKKISLPYDSVFQLFEGNSRSDKSEVSIFFFDKKADSPSSYYSVAKNALQRLRTTRHPNVIRLLEGVDVGSGVYIVTEAVTPLLDAEIFSDPSWGIFQVTSALHFLNEDCKFVHGLVSPLSIFVVKETGDWRLGGFDILRNVDSTSPAELQKAIDTHPFSSEGFRPPMALLTAGTSPGVSAMLFDRWGLATVIAWSCAAAGRPAGAETRPPEVKPETNLHKVPPSLKVALEEFLNPRPPAVAANLSTFLTRNSYFASSASVRVLDFFDKVMLKGGYERDKFFQELPAVIPSLPPRLQQLQVLPALAKQISMSSNPLEYLESVLKIGESLEGEEYRMRMKPILTKYFNSNDRATRYALLQNAGKVCIHLDKATAAELFEPLALGFTDSCAPLREVTLKAMVFFVPLLERPQVDKAFRLIQRLQQDPEPTLRTNSVICFAKVAQNLPNQQAAKLLIAVYTTALKDNYPSCRYAALQALAVTCSLFPPSEIMTRLAPLVAHRAADPDPQVRLLSFKTLDALVSFARPLLAEEAERMLRQQHQEQAVGGGDAGAVQHGGSCQIDDSVGGGAGGTSWTGWAWGKALAFTASKGDSMDARAESPPLPPERPDTGRHRGAATAARQPAPPAEGPGGAVGSSSLADEFHDAVGGENVGAWAEEDGDFWGDFGDLEDVKKSNLFKEKEEKVENSATTTSARRADVPTDAPIGASRAGQQPGSSGESITGGVRLGSGGAGRSNKVLLAVGAGSGGPTNGVTAGYGSGGTNGVTGSLGGVKGTSGGLGGAKVLKKGDLGDEDDFWEMFGLGDDGKEKKTSIASLASMTSKMTTTTERRT